MAMRPATMMMTGQLWPQERMSKVVQQEEDADEDDPDGAAEGAEEAELVAGGAVVGEAGASVGHLADEEPDAEADEEEGNEPVNGKGAEETGVADEEEAAETDEPDGSGGKTVTREGQDWGRPGRRVLRRAERAVQAGA